MSVRIGTGLSLEADPRLAAIEAGARARAALDGRGADVVCAFCTGAHLSAPEAMLEGVHEALAPSVLAGCGAGGVMADGHEVEDGTAVAIWAASLGDGAAEAFHAQTVEGPDAVAVTGLPDLDGATGAVLFCDPYGFPTEPVLTELSARSPGIPILGGLSSARTAEGGAALFVGDEVVDGGAVGLRFQGVELLPCVSQGAAPVGPALTVTDGDGHTIRELGGEPALPALRGAIEGLAPSERAMIANGLLLGIVLNGARRAGGGEEPSEGFLVRGLIGADPEAGTVSVGAEVEPGTVVRLHARDADSADRDLREALGLRREALGGHRPAGALVFTCNGRGRGLFGEPDHDATTLARELAGAPAAGFFAAGEIGPVGGSTFLHGFTATVAVFPG
ncbi:MAG TPA: FIST N-terminal domain-containing protein [Solirubrobacteraceae bacterium]|jgi:small ligand-binding sensory domain FIST|nr:FIST N-terminal domain-containing protein [Solirubrobacteraceae bacterium]